MKLIILALSLISVFSVKLRKQHFDIHSLLPNGDDKIIGSPLESMGAKSLQTPDASVQAALNQQAALEKFQRDQGGSLPDGISQIPAGLMA